MGKLKRRSKKIAERETARGIHPRLIPPIKNWDEDLPDLAEEQHYPPQLIRVNAINDVWMEIPRFEYIMWGGIWFCTLILLFSAIWCINFISLLGMLSNYLFFSLFLFPVLGFFSFFIYCLKMVLFEPRGAPVRFNRKRQKVYVYEYQRSIWPWKRWHPVIKVFDWADIHAERVLMAGHADWGHRIYCAVCKPGTVEVMDRFILTWTVGSVFDAYGLWSHCCHYMQAKPVPTAPLLTKAPASWTPFNTVRWPADIDRESTTVPDNQPA
ncbi:MULTISPECIES: DUF6708 domain-containing protein [Rahnella]|uniref:DUF6708 domain-containing protein n=1 Tax=Rahnella TaxID=34037 RepID=UPI0010DE0FAE|nr:MULTISPECIES: DUF6708 domain-containing protein [Rahnella]TCQ91451.1 hypothetical protein EC840_1029 [Rahnella sp. JUb53]